MNTRSNFNNTAPESTPLEDFKATFTDNPAGAFRALREEIITPLRSDQSPYDGADAKILGDLVSDILHVAHDLIVMNNLNENFDVIWEFGRTLHNAGRARESLTVLKEAHLLDPQNPKVLAKILETFAKLQRGEPHANYAEQALPYAKMLSEQDPDSPYANGLIGEIEGMSIGRDNAVLRAKALERATNQLEDFPLDNA